MTPKVPVASDSQLQSIVVSAVNGQQQQPHYNSGGQQSKAGLQSRAAQQLIEQRKARMQYGTLLPDASAP